MAALGLSISACCTSSIQRANCLALAGLSVMVKVTGAPYWRRGSVLLFWSLGQRGAKTAEGASDNVLQCVSIGKL